MNEFPDKKMLVVLVDQDTYDNLAELAKNKNITTVEFANQILHSISLIEVVKKDFAIPKEHLELIEKKREEKKAKEKIEEPIKKVEVVKEEINMDDLFE